MTDELKQLLLGRAQIQDPSLRASIDDPANWLSGEVAGGAGSPIKAALGAGQVLPKARDTMELVKRLQGQSSRVPTGRAQARKKLFDAPGITPLNQQQTSMMNRMYDESRRMLANPVGERLRHLEDEALRRFYRQGGPQSGLK